MLLRHRDGIISGISWYTFIPSLRDDPDDGQPEVEVEFLLSFSLQLLHGPSVLFSTYFVGIMCLLPLTAVSAPGVTVKITTSAALPVCRPILGFGWEVCLY